MDESEIVTPLYVKDWFCAIHENGYLNCEFAPIRSLMPRVASLIAKRETEVRKEGRENYALAAAERFFEQLSSAIYWEKESFSFWHHRSESDIETYCKQDLLTINIDALSSCAAEYFSMDWFRCDYLDWLFVDSFCFHELSQFYNEISREKLKIFEYSFLLKILLRKKIKEQKINNEIFKEKQISLFCDMRKAYWELGYDLISVDRVRSALKETEALGAVWPNPIWPILDRCEKLSIHAWSLSSS